MCWCTHVTQHFTLASCRDTDQGFVLSAAWVLVTGVVGTEIDPASGRAGNALALEAFLRGNSVSIAVVLGEDFKTGYGQTVVPGIRAIMTEVVPPPAPPPASDVLGMSTVCRKLQPSDVLDLGVPPIVHVYGIVLF